MNDPKPAAKAAAAAHRYGPAAVGFALATILTWAVDPALPRGWAVTGELQSAIAVLLVVVVQRFWSHIGGDIEDKI